MPKVNSRVTTGTTDICPYCKKEVEILTGKIHKKKAYHLECYLKLIEKTDGAEHKEISESEVKLLKYVAKLFALPSVSLKIKREIQDYIDRGMTYETMYLTLYYVYDILQWDFPSYLPYPTLRVIDYKYDEAIEFWNKKNLLEEKSKEYDLKNSVTVVKGKVRNRTENKQKKEIEVIDLDNMVTQIEQQEQLNELYKKEEELTKKEMQKFKQQMLSIQKEFEDKRLPEEE